MSELPSQYDPGEHEEGIYRLWERADAFKVAPRASGKPYVIVLPPPNITGTLHMGHALQDSIMDVLIRWQRMKGRPTVWVPGTDHAAIATNRVIEKQLAEEGLDRHTIGREAFEARTEQWYEKTSGEIVQQMKRLGCSCDWERQRFTMDDDYYRAVQEAFVRYFDRGIIYRGPRLVNWDPATQTTVSDLEIDWQTKKTPFYTFRYGPFEISTARPETKFGDKYVVMHPKDERYAAYAHGDTFECEWIGGTVNATIIKDEAVDPEFGTGVMTITPWHDATDFEIAQRHDLDMEQIIGLDGRLLEVAGVFSDLTIAEARPKVVQLLKEKGLLIGVDEDYEHNVALNDRGKGVIEPQVMRQWFVDMDKLRDETIAAAQEGYVSFVPSRWQKLFVRWMEEVHDWNINRQIWLGHRLPVWWKPGAHGSDNEMGSFVVSIEKPEGDYEQDPDVLDTWFSSALWPFAALGWPDKTPELQAFYPTSVLVTARDIVPLWVSRMIFSGLELLKGEEGETADVEQRLPFRDVFIHPVVLTADGQRMSKSMGTGVDPLNLISEYGADATRFGLLWQMSWDSQALKFDAEAIAAARNFTNKIWNIARFLEQLPQRSTRSVADDWMEVRVAQTARDVELLLTEYKLGEAARMLYEVVWKEYADWYVEILKNEGSTEAARQSFAELLRLLHPFIPHVTEVLWAEFGGEELLIVSSWPSGYEALDERDSLAALDMFQKHVGAVRHIRGLVDLSTKDVVEIVELETPLQASFEHLVRGRVVAESDLPAKEFAVPGGGTVTIASEHLTEERLERAREKIRKEESAVAEHIKRQQQALKQMRGKAPAEIVSEREAVIRERQGYLQQLEESRQSLV